MLEKLAKDKRSSLFCPAMRDKEKSLIILTHKANVFKLFLLSLMKRPIKLERLHLVSLSSQA